MIDRLLVLENHQLGCGMSDKPAIFAGRSGLAKANTAAGFDCAAFYQQDTLLHHRKVIDADIQGSIAWLLVHIAIGDSAERQCENSFGQLDDLDIGEG